MGFGDIAKDLKGEDEEEEDPFGDLSPQGSSGSENESSSSKKTGDRETDMDFSSLSTNPEEELFAEGNVGFFGFESQEQYNKTKATDNHGEIQKIPTERGYYKYVLPMFPRIHEPGELEPRRRYSFKPEYDTTDSTHAPRPNGYYTVFLQETQPLHEFNREMIMLDTGEVKVEDALEELSSRTGLDITPKTEVTMSILGNSIKLCCLAFNDKMDYEHDFLDEDSETKLFRNRRELVKGHGPAKWQRLKEW